MVAILLIPFLGTLLGSGMVFFMKNSISPKVEKTLLGFAGGVMTAASVWSLLIPSLTLREGQRLSWLPACLGFLLGIFFLLSLDSLIPHLHIHSDKKEGVSKRRLSRTIMLVFAVTLHNIPEGMTVGITFAGANSGSSVISLASTVTLAIGIAIQNFPEGAIISMPLAADGNGKFKAFLYGAMSGIVEPIAAFVTMILASLISPLLPYLLSFAAGAMIYVVVEELIPSGQDGEHSNASTIGFAIGFALMMVLDVALG